MAFRNALGKQLSLWILAILILYNVSVALCHHGPMEEFGIDKKSGKPMKIDTFNNVEEDLAEFQEFCELAYYERSGFTKHVRDAECSVTKPNEFDMEVDGKMLFTLIMIVAWGALVRAFIRTFDLHVPYTVVLMLSGLVIGLISKHFCFFMHEYTAIARISPKIILFTFLPILIFESAFSIPVHTFFKSVTQLLIVAFPGMVLCTFFTAAVCYFYYHIDYDWSFMEACLFGSIISATDPVAVVAILRELGVSEVLSVMIEGESLLNDGVAILLFEIFEGIIVEEEKGHWDLAQHITIKFLQIAGGGPIFGWLMGRITIFLLSFVFNDPPVEISATIVTAYLTYWLSEDVLGVSGVMAVVLLGITMSVERTVISPDSEGPVHHFWEILGYLANTVLFVLVGIVITETSLNSIDWSVELRNLALLYVAIHISRFLMLLGFYPVLTRIGYGLTWQNMIVMMWGGLRGAVGICLSLEVYRNEHFCRKPNVGDKMLFHTAGIVFLTLVLNGTTTKGLLKALKLTEISSGRKDQMNNAVKRIRRVKGRGVRIFQLSSKMFDADWRQVNEYCTVRNPYRNSKKEEAIIMLEPNALVPPQPIRENTTICPHCHTMVPNEPTSEEYKDMTEDARMNVVKAMQIAYRKVFDIGLMSDLALQILISDAERVEDQYLKMIEAKSLDKYTHIRGFYPWLKNKLSRLEKDDIRAEKPKAKFRHPFWWLVTRNWFEGTMVFIIIMNMIPIIWELIITGGHSGKDCKTENEQIGTTIFKFLNMIFMIIYTIEFLVKIIGHTAKDYFTDKWNYLDILVLIGTYVECTLSFMYEACEKNPTGGILNLVVAIRLARVARAVRLLRPLLPTLQKKVNRKINEKLFLGYDVARGFVHACDEVLRFLPQMIDNRRVLRRVKESLEFQRSECMKSMAILQQKHPGIAIALKTRHACRSVLNTMKDSLKELKDEGLLDDTEVEVLTRFLETKMKRLWHSPASIDPYAAHVLLANLSWLQNNEDLYDLILSSAELMSFGFGETLCEANDPPNGIFIIVAGMVKITYAPSDDVIEARIKYGKIPNSELCSDLTFSHREEDYFSTGFLIGETSSLTGELRASSITAETSLVVYHISKSVIEHAIKTYNDEYDSFESQLWRSVGIRRATGLLGQLPQFQMMNPERLQTHLQRSTVPIGEKYNVLDIPSYVSEVVVIEGYATNASTNEVYIAPFLVPLTCSRLLLPQNPSTVNRVLIVASEDLDLNDPDDEETQEPADDYIKQLRNSFGKKRSSGRNAVVRFENVRIP